MTNEDDEVTTVIPRETMADLIYGAPALVIEDWDQPTTEIPPVELALLVARCGARDTGSLAQVSTGVHIPRTRTRDLK
jgi:hypothetical protein